MGPLRRKEEMSGVCQADKEEQGALGWLVGVGPLSTALPKPDGWAGLPLKEQACNRP